MRGSRPWAQFLVYANYVAEIDGSKSWAAQLEDERYLPLIKKRLKQIEKERLEVRPALNGYSREVDAMFRVATELRMLRAEMGRWTVAPQILGPVFPSEKIRRMDDAVEVSDLETAIEVGHRNWKEAMTRA